MVDIFDAATRSRVMSKIRGKDTKPEVMIRKKLHGLGLRYRLHDRGLPGSPDLVLKKHRAVVFVNGCFWHRHECDKFREPSSRKSYWRKKLNRNRERDQEVRQELSKLGWRTAVVWECALKAPKEKSLERIAGRIQKWLAGNRKTIEIS